MLDYQDLITEDLLKDFKVILIFKETLILIKIIFKLSLLIILNIIQEYKVAHNIIDLKK